MKVRRLSEDDKTVVGSWKYQGAYAQFNYALEESGWIDSYCDAPHSPCYSCEVDGKIVGVFLFIPQKENEFRVLVNPEELSKGYGKQITRIAIETALNTLGYKKISLIVRKDHAVALSLYQKMGFVEVGETTEAIRGEEVLFYKILLKL